MLDYGLSPTYDASVSVNLIPFGGWMSYRCLWLIVLTLAEASSGFTQTLADLARAERARRDVLTKSGSPPDTPATLLGHEALIKEALRVSGARRQLERHLETSLPLVVNGSVPDGMPAQEYRRIVNEVFRVEHLMPMMEKSVSDTINDRILIDIVRWYRLPLGKKIATAEVDANGPDAPARLQHFASMLQSSAPSANRQQLVEGLSATALGIPRPFPDFEKISAAATESPARGNPLWLLFVYHSLSEAELSAYLTFLKSPAVGSFNNSVWNGLDVTFGDAAQRLRRKLAETKR